MRTRIKICCIASRDEAWTAIDAGVDALGLVSTMPSGPGVISDEAVAHVAAGVPPPIATFLLTSRLDAAAIAAQKRASGANVLQLVDYVDERVYGRLREELPGVRLVQVVHVCDADDVSRATRIAPHVDALLLDSGNPGLPVKVLGGTGRVHDWMLSRAVREAVSVPVFLAGGLRAENVAEAIRAVRPFGVDVCSGVRTDGRLDEGKLRRFVDAVRAANAD